MSSVTINNIEILSNQNKNYYLKTDQLKDEGGNTGDDVIVKTQIFNVQYQAPPTSKCTFCADQKKTIVNIT